MRPTRRSGFTLVELLVVISIIIILAAIVVPVTLRVGALSRITSCKNNLKQIHAGLFTYAQSYAQRFPGREGGYVVGGVEKAPTFTPYRYVNVLFETSFDMPNDFRGDDDLSPLFSHGYVPDVRVFNCPSTGDSVNPKRKDESDTLLPKGYDLMFKATESHPIDEAEFRANAGTGPRGELSYEYLGEVAPGLHLGELNAGLAWLVHDIDDREDTEDWTVDGDNHGTTGGCMLFIDGRAEWIIASDWTKAVRDGHDERLANVDAGAKEADVPEDAVRGEWDKQTGWPNPALDVEKFYWSQ
ncbi:prepilin-type N-terminal cleavage/methylation domain-containing protein [bacterium]|nr:prepilin-type N-terminal cleavage/methylation domain-containing protein [bacterium]